MRSKLRYYWLAFLRDLKMWRTSCRVCGRYGAYPCSICGGIKLCTQCQRMESIRLDKRLHEPAKN